MAFERGPAGAAAAVEEDGEEAQRIAACPYLVATDPEGNRRGWGAGIL